jgi:DNA replication protein DnaC
MNYDEILNQLKTEGNPTPSPRFRFSIPNAREELEKAMAAVLSRMGEKLVWLPEYDKVADWLSDNNGKGLFLYGSCGRGKSLLVRYAIPMLFRGFCRRFVYVVDCGTTQQNIDEILRRKFIALDDIGTEVDRKDFGTLRNVVVEAINKAQDDTGTMLIISSNLSAEAIRDRYGDRILDRIKYLCRRVAFNGKSLRK